MREQEVQAAFVYYLQERGWDVTTENDDYVDVIAKRGSECIVAEVKGATSSAGLDVDTAYGQLLRRMDGRGEQVRYALVVPRSLAETAQRVPPSIRAQLGIEVLLVDDDGRVAPAEL